MIKTYTVAGTATDKNGKTTVRYSNNLQQRIQLLKRSGYTNLNFIESKTPKTKKQLCNEMLGLIQFQWDKQVIENEINKLNNRMIKITARLGN